MEIKVLDQFPQLVLNKESVFKIMDCHEESTVYGEVAREYERLEPWLYEKVHPKAVIAWEPQSSSLLERLRLPEGKAEPGIYLEPKSRGFLYLVMTLRLGSICQECCLAPWPTSIFFCLKIR